MSTRGSTISARPRSAEPGQDEVPASAFSALRMCLYGLVLAFLAFIQSPGYMVGDTKFDLVVDPGRFLSRALEMWDGSNAFGQIQNQAYGYFFPMGPFFWIADQVHLDPWVTQRLWWTLLLCIAFYGALKVARTLDLGKPWSQVLAAFVYALSGHITTVIGSTSIEVWPSALAPWILWCAIRGTAAGSERRWAAAAGLLVAACGGVNAAAVLGALPLGACWVATRQGRRAWVFFGWWVLATLLATLWWLVPLFLLGAYSFPFLDYIETASITTLPTGLSDVVGGTSDWVFFYGGSLFPAGYSLATAPFLILDAMILAAIGFAGIARTDNPHRRFLLLAVVVGVVLVSFGFTGNGHGWFADVRQGWLDGVLAPLRNLHKFDNVLRLPLVLGLAHLLGRLPLRGERALPIHRLTAAVAGLAVVLTASPWWIPQVATTGPIESVPEYWQQAADYLNAQDADNTTSLVVPASAFGLYLWGSPRDDILQPLMQEPWAARNVVPFAQPGSVTLLNAITEVVESGKPSSSLARLLAANGIERVVVRNDLDPIQTGAPDPVVVHGVLDNSPNLERVAGFGPPLGSVPVAEVDGARVAPAGGLSGSYQAVEVYDVTLPVHQVQTVPLSSVRVAVGGAPGDSLLGGTTTPTLIGTPELAPAAAPVVLSDALARREEAFAEVRKVESETMTPGQPWQLDRPVHQRMMTADQESHESYVAWRGVDDVTASTSRAWPNTRPPIQRGQAPGAAMDGSSATEWQSELGTSALGQWWQVDLVPGTDVQDIVIRLPRSSSVTTLSVSNGDQQVDLPAPAPGRPLAVPTGFGASDHLRVTATEVADGTEFEPFAISEVRIDGVEPERTVVLPQAPADRDVAEVSLSRDPGTPACREVTGAVVCRDGLASYGDDSDRIDRTFDLPTAGEYTLTLAGSWADGTAVTRTLMADLPVRVDTTVATSSNVRAGPLALIDHDPRTSWISAASIRSPELRVTWPKPRTIGAIRLPISKATAAAQVTRVKVSAGGKSREVSLDARGAGSFAPLRARRVTVEILGVARAFDTSTGAPVPLPAGARALHLSRRADGPDLLGQRTHRFRGGCGTGPTVAVDGRDVRTSYSATMTQVMSGQVDLRACAESVPMAAGEHEIVAPATSILLADHLQLERAGQPAPESPQGLAASTWDNETRVVDVPAADDERLFVVSQNFNDGWKAKLDGTALKPQLVDGWRQGWWLPAGAAGAVTMSFTPQPWFEAGLVAGVVGLLVVVGLALVPVRRPARSASEARVLPRGVGAVAMVLVGGLLAGWVGALTAAAVIAVLVVWQPVRDHAEFLAGGLVLVAGVAAAILRSGQQLNYHAWVQWVLVAALAAALAVSSRPKGPLLRNRMKGRSIT